MATYSLKQDVDSCGIGNSLRVDLPVLGRVNRRLTMLRSNNDESLVVYVLFNQLGHDFTERIVHKIDSPKYVRRKV